MTFFPHDGSLEGIQILETKLQKNIRYLYYK